MAARLGSYDSRDTRPRAAVDPPSGPDRLNRLLTMFLQRQVAT